MLLRSYGKYLVALIVMSTFDMLMQEFVIATYIFEQ